MDFELTAVETRILGSLIEKELTTPEYYPLTLHSLTTACNQKSNREPVMNLGEREVELAVEKLRSKNLVWRRNIAGSRVSKYEHNVENRLNLSPKQKAVLAVLFLRGPQTIGEIKGRTGRMYEFNSLQEVESVLEDLRGRTEEPLVVQLPREAGKKENRFTHLLAGYPSTDVQSTETEVETHSPEISSPDQSRRSETQEERIKELEDQVHILSERMDSLKKQLDEFQKILE